MQRNGLWSAIHSFLKLFPTYVCTAFIALIKSVARMKSLTAAAQPSRRVQTKVVSPRQYLNLSQAEKSRLGHVRIVVPQLGDAAAFGSIELTYK